MNGIPNLLNIPSGSNLTNSALSLVQGAIWDALSLHPNWGVYQNGKPVILGYENQGLINQVQSLAGLQALANGEEFASEVYIDSVFELSQSKRSEVAFYRVETGQFSSYNEVEIPRTIPVRLVKNGSYIFM